MLWLVNPWTDSSFDSTPCISFQVLSWPGTTEIQGICWVPLLLIKRNGLQEILHGETIQSEDGIDDYDMIMSFCWRTLAYFILMCIILLRNTSLLILVNEKVDELLLLLTYLAAVLKSSENSWGTQIYFSSPPMNRWWGKYCPPLFPLQLKHAIEVTHILKTLYLNNACCLYPGCSVTISYDL